MPVHHLLKPDIGRIIVLGGLQSGPLYQSVNSARTEVTGRALNRGEGEERVCARHARQNFLSQDADHRRSPLRESPRKKDLALEETRVTDAIHGSGLVNSPLPGSAADFGPIFIG
jgi:hypothetical protein